MKKPKAFASEVELCATFLEAVDKRKWTPYPETCGWDILLVRRADGFQIGIQAKLRMGVDVINQALDEYAVWDAGRPGPDCRALLVPTTAGFGRICDYLGLVVIVVEPTASWLNRKFNPALPDAPPATDFRNWPEWAPASRHPLPEYVPDVPAGASAPVQLTDWKIRALKLTVLLEKHGSVRRSDFTYLQLDHRRWIEGGWLVLQNGEFVAGSRSPDFKAQHPKVYVKIAEDFELWRDKKRPETLGALL